MTGGGTTITMTGDRPLALGSVTTIGGNGVMATGDVEPVPVEELLPLPLPLSVVGAVGDAVTMMTSRGDTATAILELE